MMNKLIKILFIQSILSASFFALANDNATIIPATPLLINGQNNPSILGYSDKAQLFAISGCPGTSNPMWSWKQHYLDGSETSDTPVGLTQDFIADPTGKSYFTQDLGGQGGNAREWLEYSYKCEDTLNPGTPLATYTEARIKVYMQRVDNPTYQFPKGNPAWQYGEYTQCTDGRDLIVRLTTSGCPSGPDIYWVHPTSSLNTLTVGTDTYWEKISNNFTRDVSGGNVIPDATYTAKCKIQYYDASTHQTVEELTRGFDIIMPKKVQPLPEPNLMTTYTYFTHDANLISLQLCPQSQVSMTSTLFKPEFSAKIQGYSWAWGIDQGSSNGYRKAFDNKQTINANEAGRYYLYFSNGIKVCDRKYDVTSNREIKIIANLAPILDGGDSKICPGADKLISISNSSNFTNASGSTYNWFINGQLVQNAQGISYTIDDKAVNVQASYPTNSQDGLGNTCDSPKSEVLIITKFNRPASPSITQNAGKNIYCEDIFPVSDVIIEANNPLGAQLKSYTWSLGSNVISGINTNTISTNIFSGKYTAIVTDLNGCNSLPSNVVLIDQYPRPAKPVITNLNGKDAYCDYNIPFNAITLQTTNTSLVGSGTLSWNTGANTSRIDVITDGKYEVTVTDDRGCISEKGEYSIIKYTRPATPTITNTNGLAAYCDYNIPFTAVTLQSTNTSLVGSPKYTWSTGSTDATATVTKEGIYTVTVTDNNDCASLPGKYEIVKYTRPAKPVVTRKTGSDAYCDYKFPVSDLTLESTNTALVGDAKYTWNKVLKTKVIPVTTEGAYSVVVTDGNGCESVSSDPYTITKWTSPVAPKIALTGKNINCAVDENDKAVTVAFSVSSATDGYSFEWFNTGSASVLSKTNALSAVSSNGTYYSIQTDKNGCYSPKSDGIKVTFVQNPSFSAAKISKIGAYGLRAEGLGAWDNATAGDYQWKSGATINAGTIDNIKVTAANNGNGDYSVKRKYAFTVENTPIVCFSNLVKYTFVADPDFTGVAVYPNPTSGTVKIDLLDEWKNATVVVYDLVGRPVYNGTMDALAATGNSLSIDLSSLGSGLYILQIKSSTGDRSYQGKILVNK